MHRDYDDNDDMTIKYNLSLKEKYRGIERERKMMSEIYRHIVIIVISGTLRL